MGAARTLSSGKGPPSRCPPFPMRRFARCASFESFKSSSSRIKIVLSLEASMAAWWLRARARLPHMWRGSNTISFSGICRCGLVEYLGSLQKISASNSAPNRAEVVEHPPRPTRALMLSYGASMALGIHGQHKSATWKMTERPSCPLQDPSWDMATQMSFAPRSRIR